MAGFFDLTDPDNAALLGMASGLLQAGAPSRLPMPLGAALGRGLQAGLAAEAGRRLRDPATIAAIRRRLALAGALPFGAARTPPAGPMMGSPMVPPVWGGPPVSQ